MAKISHAQKATSNKKRFILTFVLITLILFPLITTSLAMRTSDTGVEVGETYEWALKVNIFNYINLLRNEGGVGGQFEAEIVSMSLPGEVEIILFIPVHIDLIVGSVFPAESFFDVYVEIDVNTIGLAPDFNISQIPIFFPLDFPIKPTLGQVNFTLFKGDKSSYFSDPNRIILITAPSVNWTDAATSLSTHFRRNMIAPNFTVSPQTNGLRISRPADTTSPASEVNLNYNEIGVLETADGSYDGSPLFNLELLSEENNDENGDDAGDYRIGFEPTFFLGVFALTIVIILVRKRKGSIFKS